MNTYQFKTNINCGGCIAKVTPYLNSEEHIKNWNVDTTNPQKILTVQTEGLAADAVEKLVTKAGFKAEALQ